MLVSLAHSLCGDVVRQDGSRCAVEVVDGHLEGHGGLVLQGLLGLLHDLVVYPLVDAVVLFVRVPCFRCVCERRRAREIEGERERTGMFS